MAVALFRQHLLNPEVCIRCNTCEETCPVRERGRDVAELLRGDTFVYICGLKGMEAGVIEALGEVCADWPSLHERYVREGRVHVETY